MDEYIAALENFPSKIREIEKEIKSLFEINKKLSILAVLQETFISELKTNYLTMAQQNEHLVKAFEAEILNLKKDAIWKTLDSKET